MKIIVLAGGLSPEREVSLTSGSLIANALMEYCLEAVMLINRFVKRLLITTNWMQLFQCPVVCLSPMPECRLLF